MTDAPDLGLLNQHGRGYWASAVLFAAVRLGLFTHVANGARTPEAAAEAMGADARYVRALMDCCAAMGLLRRDGAAYTNTPTADAFLVSDSPLYQGDMSLHRGDLWDAWRRLDEAVLVGAPRPYEPAPEAAPGYWRRYLVGHEQMALAGLAGFLVSSVPLEPPGELLDVGGGAAPYSVAFCQRYPWLRAEVLDVPDALAVAGERVRTAGLADRIRLAPGDYNTTSFGLGRSGVLFSLTLCAEPDSAAQRLLRRGWEALGRGGALVVQDALWVQGQEARQAPLSFFHMMVLLQYSAGGGVRDAETVAAWLRDLGCKDAAIAAGPGIFSVVWGRR